jgi:hypothetical protein
MALADYLIAVRRNAWGIAPSITEPGNRRRPYPADTRPAG